MTSGGRTLPYSADQDDRERDRALAQWLRERIDRKSDKHAGHSVYFDRFPPRTIKVPPGYATDYLGNMLPVHFGWTESPGTYETTIPEITEEYFEVLDIFEAVLDARGTFNMHEWGSGFARWTSFGIRAAREQGIEDIKCTCVEAEPKHLAFSIEMLSLLGVPAQQSRFYPFALSGKTETSLFVIGRKGTSGNDPWFGQALNDMGAYEATGDEYFSQPVVENPLGFRAIEVLVEPPSTILKDERFVDLIDMDIQGAEADAVEECINELDSKVRRLHIGTHSAAVEERLRAVLGSHGWILLRDLPNHAPSVTAFGEVNCVDGVQSWFNPRFPPPDWRETPI